MKTLKSLVKLSSVFAFLLATALLVTVFWISKKFGDVKLDAIIFHLLAPVKGVDPGVLFSILKRVAVIFVLTAVYGLILFIKLPKIKPRKQRCLKIALVLLSIPYLMTVTYFVDSKYGIYEFYNTPPSVFVENNYVAPDLSQIAFAEEKHNLILIVLESVEQTFNDTDIFSKPIIPELHELRESSVSFHGYRAAAGSGWTIAALTNFFFGVPLKLPNIYANNYDNKRFASFLPGAISIFEVLEANGYKIDFFLGSDVQFSGKDNLFNSHTKNVTIHDLSYYIATRDDVPENKGSDWGMSDYYVYERAKEFLTRERKQDENFAVIIETVDTHLPNGYVAPGFPIEYHDMRDSMRAAGIMANDFVQWARQQVFFANTTIVLITDHFLMADNLGGVSLPFLKRDIYNAFINQVPSAPAQAGHRAYCAFDIAPTLLESIGARLPNGRFGLGTSLFGAQPTLLEQMPINRLNHELAAFSPFYQKFYNP